MPDRPPRALTDWWQSSRRDRTVDITLSILTLAILAYLAYYGH